MTPLRGLYVITDPVLTPPQRLLGSVEAALRGGARLVQYRDKSTDHARRLEDARALRSACHRYGALLIINDDVELCASSGADGVHLGLEDMSVVSARRRLGAGVIIGATCHGSPSLAAKAITDGASYVAFGRFFASATKPDAPPARLDEVGPALGRLPVPACAIGGVTLATAPGLLRAGFAMLAVVGDVFAAGDIEARCRSYAAMFD